MNRQLKNVCMAMVVVTVISACVTDSSTMPEPMPTPIHTPRSLPIVAVAATQLPDYWQLVDELVLQTPVTSGRNLQFGCVAVHFGIDAEGRTFDPQVRKSYPQGRFAEQALEWVRGWQFEPVAANPIRQPVRTERVLTIQSVDGSIRLVEAEHVSKFCRS